MARLRSIVKYSDKKEKKTPIEKFLTENGVRWKNLESKEWKEVKFKVDVVLGHTRLKKAGYDQITKEKVNEFLEKVGALSVNLIWALTRILRRD